MEFWKKIKQIHLTPTDFYEDLDSEGFSTASKFVGLIGLLLGSLMTIFAVVGSLNTEYSLAGVLGISLFLLAFLPIALLANAFFQACLVHIAVYIFGKRGFDTTYNAVAYPISAVLLWGWIPVLNIVAGLYSIYLQAKGVEILHEMTFGRALITAIWPIIASLIITVGLWILLLIGFTAA